jgi:FHA domain
MSEKTDTSPKKNLADWFFRGALTRLGDSLDNLTGRKWSPSSSLAASELVERIKKLLNSEAVEVPGKGTVVPHEISLKMQWDKFSDDVDESLRTLENELLAAAVDHINDSLYYTYAPVSLEIKPDYFIEGVKLYVSFGKFRGESPDMELNVTVPSMDLGAALRETEMVKPNTQDVVIVRFLLKGIEKEFRLEFGDGPLSVGRAATNDLVLDDASVSKMHASLSVSDSGSLSVADTGSTNGTFINDERISYGKAVGLENGDKVKFGQIEVRFEQLPRPAIVEPQPSQDEPVVEIDGFEFKRKSSAESLPNYETVERKAPLDHDLDASTDLANETIDVGSESETVERSE